jgi:hypothetical protein
MIDIIIKCDSRYIKKQLCLQLKIAFKNFYNLLLFIAIC